MWVLQELKMLADPIKRSELTSWVLAREISTVCHHLHSDRCMALQEVSMGQETVRRLLHKGYPGHGMLWDQQGTPRHLEFTFPNALRQGKFIQHHCCDMSVKDCYRLIFAKGALLARKSLFSSTAVTINLDSKVQRHLLCSFGCYMSLDAVPVPIMCAFQRAVNWGNSIAEAQVSEQVLMVKVRRPLIC